MAATLSPVALNSTEASAYWGVPLTGPPATMVGNASQTPPLNPTAWKIGSGSGPKPSPNCAGD